MDTNNISVSEMEQFVARFATLHGSEEAFVDSRLPGHRRFKVNHVGMGDTAEGEKSITLEPFDSISVPQGVYRGFRHVGEGKGTLLTIIGGPDAGRVDWHPDITDAAADSGLARDEAGDLKVTA
ncbi:unnamed protein product [Laminaria digitata]